MANLRWGVLFALSVVPAAAWAQPGAEGLQPEAPPPGPEAQAPTRAAFVSTGAVQWDVLVDGEPVCATPCSGPLHPLQFVVLRSHERNPVLVEVGRLPPGDLLVSGRPVQHGMYAGGVVATSLGGMALAVGITLSSIGLAKDRAGMTTAGLITGAAGALSLSGGIYLMVRALPGATVEPASPRVAGTTVGLGGRF